MDTFSRPSLQLSRTMIDNVLSKGSQILYDHYLVDRLPQHSTLQNVMLVKGIMTPEVHLVRKAQTISNDAQPQRIQKDSLTSKSLQIKRIPVSTIKFQPKPAPIQQKLAVKHRFSSTHRSSAHSQTKALVNRMEQLTEASPFIKLDPEPTEGQRERLQLEERMRKKRKEQLAEGVLQKQKSKEQEDERNQRLEGLRKEYEELEKRHQRYTYDFDGKIINCGPVNSKVPLFSRSIYAQIKAKLDNKSPKQPQKPRHKSRDHSNQTRTTTSKSEMFNSVVFNSVHASKLTKALKGNSLGVDFMRNQTFNNNNKRQISNINIIQISDGAKLTELDNHVVIGTDKKLALTLKDFTAMNSSKRFKSFLSATKPEFQEAIEDDFDINNPYELKDSKATTTKLPSSMSGRTKKYTFRDTFNNETNRKPMTATESVRKKSEIERPRTTAHSSGRVIPNENMIEVLFQ